MTTRNPQAGQPGDLYISTAIPYVNAAPHIGFALELVQTDALARFYRAAGHGVRFQTGSDENSLKNVEAARTAAVPVADFVAGNAARYRALRDSLDLSFDDFIRTSADPRHRRGVEALWRALEASGDIYKRAYRGLYCTGCEQFYKPGELEGGLCPEHGTAPEEVAEESHFFRLSRYRERLLARIAGGGLGIEPAERRNEVLRLLEGGLEDISISRPKARAHGWGIPVPGDPDQVVYVWLDALVNYITALGYGGAGYDGDDSGGDGDSGGDTALLQRFWHRAARRQHVVGKGITRFHAVYWPAFLLSAGLPLPDRILVHGYLTVEGAKIGKSRGNAVDPEPLAAAYGSEALRYYLLRHIRSTGDGDFSEARLRRAYRSDLADKLGNLVQRSLAMIVRYRGGSVPQSAIAGPLAAVAGRLPSAVAEQVEAFALHDALAAVFDLVQQANRFVTETAPWDLAKQGEAAAPALDACLHDLAYALRAAALALVPFLPATAAAILDRLGFDSPDEARASAVAGRAVRPGAPLFPPLPGERAGAPSGGGEP